MWLNCNSSALQIFLFCCLPTCQLIFRALGPVSRKSRKLFGPEKPFVKFRPAYSVKLVFSYVVKGIKFKTTAKFCASRRRRFEDTRGIMSPEMLPKSFGTFEERAPGPKVFEHRTIEPSNEQHTGTWAPDRTELSFVWERDASSQQYLKP